jgi:hypothetical protein
MNGVSLKLLTLRNFLAGMLDLLSDMQLFGDIDNLVVNTDEDDSFKPFGGNKTGQLDEVLDGEWYQKTVEVYVEKEGKNMRRFVLPIIFYVDKTGTTQNQRHGVEPLVFTVGILKRELRNQPRAWRVLGYIPDLEQKSSAVKKASRTTLQGMGIGTRNYHNVLRVIMESYYTAQQRPSFNADLRIGEYVGRVNLRVPLAFVIGDAKSRDMLTGRYSAYTGVARITAACHTPQHKCADHTHQCEFATSELFEHYSALASDRGVDPMTTEQENDLTPKERKEREGKKKRAKKERTRYTKLLHEMSQHRHLSAFVGCDFGANTRGIIGATPTDLMHAFLEGVLKYALRIYVDPMSPKHKKLLDLLIDKIFGKLRSAENARSDFLKSNYTHGYTNLTMLTADEWAEMAFTLLVACKSKEGSKILTDAGKYVPEDDDMAGLADLIEDVAPKASVDMSNKHKSRTFDSVIAQRFASEDFCDKYFPSSSADVPPVPEGEDEHELENEFENVYAADHNYGVEDDGQREEEETDSPGLPEHGLVELLEMVLSFHAYYNRGAPYDWRKPAPKRGASPQADTSHDCYDCQTTSSKERQQVGNPKAARPPACR